MFDLKKVSNSTYYVDFPVKVGVYNYEADKVVLIDTGAGKSFGKHILSVLRENGFTVTAIFNTHQHSDHTGGNAYIQSQTGCKIFCPEIDMAAIKYPVLNNIMLYGAYPFSGLNNSLFTHDAAKVEKLCEEVLPKGLEFFPLPGHTLGQVGYMTSDKVAFLGDSLISLETLEKYKITYLISVEEQLKTLEMLESFKADVYIPAHIGELSDITDSIKNNRRYIENNITEILKFCLNMHNSEEITEYFFCNNDVLFNSSNYALINSTVKSYLSYLELKGDMEFVCDGNNLKFRTVIKE